MTQLEFAQLLDIPVSLLDRIEKGMTIQSRELDLRMRVLFDMLSGNHERDKLNYASEQGTVRAG